MAVQDFEKLGVFYLGRLYDLDAGKPKEGLLLYDSKDLVTHAVCIGMTGSGKTGLCLSLLEEALIDGIPALIIDPKGDLSDLLLTFPDLRPEDFLPWVNDGDAAKRGLTRAAFAEQQAALWKRGLEEWGQSGERIRRLRDAAEIAIYTPGSNAGLPVSILASFAAPAAAVREDGDALRERIATAATSLLGLLGVDADPLRSREHILISKILETAWQQGRDLDLPGLIQQIQTPPIDKVGVLDLNAFFPAPDRFQLAMLLNNLLAAPGFDAWLQGESLDVDRMLHTAAGKPRAAIFSIAHLGEAERMFFVSLLLNETLSWMRAQPGTTSLRAILYMDEIFGYFPPVANPPSKQPLLTLLKQARAFGLGVVLATQNPVDLDYKGLANTGTWFIGRLQTERDKARVLDGLQGAAVGSERFDRQQMEEVLAGLGNRIFLLHNVHEEAPEVFETRWAMSYLAGPLTRDQIKHLTGPSAPAAPAIPQAAAAVPPAVPAAAPMPDVSGVRPVLPPQVPQIFVPWRGSAPGLLCYRPMILGAAAVHFSDRKTDVDVSRDLVFATPVSDGAVPMSWEDGEEMSVAMEDVETSPREPAQFGPVPPAAANPKSYAAWTKDFAAWIYSTQQVELRRSPGLGLVSKPGESERDFRIRLQEAGREERDRKAEQLRRKYAPKTAQLEERLRRAQQAVEREREQAKHQGLQAAISVGATLLGAFLGRKTLSSATLGRAATSARGVGRVLKESQDVGRAAETVESVRQRMADLESEFRAEMTALDTQTDALNEQLESVLIRPKKSGINVRLVALAWVPQSGAGDVERGRSA